MKNNQGIRGYRVGIDASCWIYKQVYRHGQTKNPELASLHANVNKIFNMAMIPLFVFDGASRPNCKRTKLVRGNAHWLEEDFKRMLTAYGFQYFMAPGEAEAELAYLNQVGSIDAVWTEDSDVFVFGAARIFRVLTDDRDTFEATIYTSFNISNHTEIGLTHDDLIFVALLAGGDYSSGLPGCGTKTAIQLARTGIGRDLIDAVRRLSSLEASNFACKWVNRFKAELECNDAKQLLQRYPKLASSMPPDFPDIDVARLYVRPLTSADSGGLPSLNWMLPDLAALARFAEESFVWGHRPGILNHFSATIFPGFALRELIGDTLQRDNQPNPFSPLCRIIDSSRAIVSERRSPTTGHMAELRIAIPVTRYFFDVITESLQGRYGTTEHDAEAVEWMERSADKVRAWVPLTVMQNVYPTLVDAFTAKQANKLRKTIIFVAENEVIDLTGNHEMLGDSGDVIDLTTMDDDSSSYASPLSSKRYTILETSPNVLEFFTDSEGEY